MSKRFPGFFTKLYPRRTLFTLTGAALLASWMDFPENLRKYACNRAFVTEGFCYHQSMLLSVQGLGALYAFCVLIICVILVFGFRLARIGWRTLAKKLPPDPPPKEEKTCGTRLFPRRAQEKTRPGGILRAQAHRFQVKPNRPYTVSFPRHSICSEQRYFCHVVEYLSPNVTLVIVS